MYFTLSVLSAIFALSATSAVAQEEAVTSKNGDLCYASCSADESGNEVCTFTTKINLFAGELGYYQFEECGDDVNPTLGMELGKTYKFVQKDRSNYYHPLGFAYYPDGAHADADELEPGIAPPGSSSDCDKNMTCAAPMYYVDGDYKGTYSNNEDLVALTNDEDNFGLDDYEPLFFHPLPDWIGYGEFSVFLKVDDTDFSSDIFYFCHIHQFMTGRIKLLRNGEPIQKDVHLPELGYEYDMPAQHDNECGTYGLDEFKLPHAECPEKFVCDVTSDNRELQQFSSCIDSMNCAMMVGMTTSVKDSESEVALFLHQMIPHHQNAVNMAKALLKTGKLNCDDLTDEESEQADDCALEIILREIVNNQNSQIQAMRALLEAKNYPEENDCKVLIGGMFTGDVSSNGSDVVSTGDVSSNGNDVSTVDVSPKKEMSTSLGENSSNHITNSGVVFGMLLALSLSFV